MTKREQQIQYAQEALENRSKYMKKVLTSNTALSSNYTETIQYYNALRKRFLMLLQERTQQDLDESGQMFISTVNNQYMGAIAPLARSKMFKRVQEVKEGIAADLVSIITGKQKRGGKISKSVSQAHKIYTQEKQTFAEKTEEEKQMIIDEMLNAVKELMTTKLKKSITALLHNRDVDMDYTDLLNKVLLPYIKSVFKAAFAGASIEEIQSIKYHNIPAAAGYWYEAEYANVMSQIYDNISFFQAGHKNAAYDTIATFTKGVASKQAVTGIEKDLKKLDKGIEDLSITCEIPLDELLDPADKNSIMSRIKYFGVQNKIYDLDLNKATSFNFKRITGNVELLNKFQAQNPNITDLNDGLARSALFLSQFKHATQVFGRLNVLYAQGTKTVWTSDLIRSMLNAGRYLIFKYTQENPVKFTSSIGAEQLIKI